MNQQLEALETSSEGEESIELEKLTLHSPNEHHSNKGTSQTCQSQTITSGEEDSESSKEEEILNKTPSKPSEILTKTPSSKPVIKTYEKEFPSISLSEAHHHFKTPLAKHKPASSISSKKKSSQSPLNQLTSPSLQLPPSFQLPPSVSKTPLMLTPATTSAHGTTSSSYSINSPFKQNLDGSVFAPIFSSQSSFSPMIQPSSVNNNNHMPQTVLELTYRAATPIKISEEPLVETFSVTETMKLNRQIYDYYIESHKPVKPQATYTRAKCWDDADDSEEELHEEEENNENHPLYQLKQLKLHLSQLFYHNMPIFQQQNELYLLFQLNNPVDSSTIAQYLDIKNILSICKLDLTSLDFIFMNNLLTNYIQHTHYTQIMNQSLQLSTYTEPLQQCISYESMIYDLLDQLAYEDLRFNSKKLLVLKSFYQFSTLSSSSSSYLNSQTIQKTLLIRQQILQNMYYITLQKLQRCQSLYSESIQYEMDVNFIAKSGVSNLVATSTTSEIATKPSAMLSSCINYAITGVIQSKDERLPYKVHDHCMLYIELLKYIVYIELQDCYQRCQTPPNIDDYEEYLLLLFQQVKYMMLSACKIFQTYGYRLGNTSELIENQTMLKELLVLNEIILYLFYCLQLEYYIHDLASFSSMTLNELLQQQQCDLPCEYLKFIQKTWSYDKELNYAQEIALIKLCEMVMIYSSPLNQFTSSTSSISSSSVSTPSASLTTTTSTQKYSLSSIKFTPKASIPCLLWKKIIQSIFHVHYKVSQQALLTLQNPNLLNLYFLPLNAYFFQQFHIDDNHQQTKLQDYNDDRLCLLVENLRQVKQGRGYWHPLVQSLASTTLDIVTNKLNDCPVDDSYE